MYKDYGSIIKNARLQKGLSQEDLAIKLGVSRQAISNWETNKCIPDVSIIPNLCKILDMNIYDFFDNKKGKEILDYETKRSKQKFIMVILSLITIIISTIIIIIFIIFQNKFEVYELIFENSYKKFDNFYFIYSRDELILNIGSISDTTEETFLTFYIDNLEQTALYSTNYDSSILIKEEYGYNDSLNLFYKNKENIYLRIDTLNGTETYKVKFNKILGSNKVIYKKAPSIGKNDEKIAKTENYFDSKALENNKYKFNESLGYYEKKVGDYNYIVTPASQSLMAIGLIGDEEITLDYSPYMNTLMITIYNGKSKKTTLNCSYDFSNKKIDYFIGNENIVNYVELIKNELTKLAIDF